MTDIPLVKLICFVLIEANDFFAVPERQYAIKFTSKLHELLIYRSATAVGPMRQYLNDWPIMFISYMDYLELRQKAIAFYKKMAAYDAINGAYYAELSQALLGLFFCCRHGSDAMAHMNARAPYRARNCR